MSQSQGLERLAEAARLPSPVVELADERLAARGVRLLLKRDDLIHPDVPGNKWRKLKLNLHAAVEQGHRTLLTFGGAYSNHLRAVAAAGEWLGLRTIGVVRGEEHHPLNPSLAYAAAKGMRLTYVDRATYREKHLPAVLDRLEQEFGECYVLPEGGSNAAAVRGCADLPAEIAEPFDVICCPVGTGGTLAGIAAGLRDGQQALGFAVLKGASSLTAEVEQLQRAAFGSPTKNWRIEPGFHFGGFAKRTPELDTFVAGFSTRHRLRLERVYVAKQLAGIYALVDQGRFEPGATIVAVVTGPAFEQGAAWRAGAPASGPATARRSPAPARTPLQAWPAASSAQPPPPAPR